MSTIEYAEETAGYLANKSVPTCKPTDTVGTVLAFIRELAQTYESLSYIYVLEGRTLVGVLSIHELFCAESEASIASIMTTEVAFAHTQTDQEHVAQLALAQGVKAVPVIGNEKEFVGVISSDKILRILNEEHLDDVYKSAGFTNIESDDSNFHTWTNQVTARTPWLLLGLVGGIGAAVVVESFEHTLSAQLALAAFIPAVVYVADAVGNQAEILFIRRLSRREPVSLIKYLAREWGIGATIALILGSLTFGASFLWLGDVLLSAVLAFSIIVTVMFSITVTVLLPWIFQKLNYDPAIASGPLATVICDLSSVTIYLLIATALL